MRHKMIPLNYHDKRVGVKYVVPFTNRGPRICSHEHPCKNYLSTQGSIIEYTYNTNKLFSFATFTYMTI